MSFKRKKIPNSTIYTVKIKHNIDLKNELRKAVAVANFCIEFGANTTADVKQFGLQSAFAKQIVQKYTRPVVKKVKRVKLTISGCDVRIRESSIWIPQIKLDLPFNIWCLKVNQIEFDENFAYVAITLPDQVSKPSSDWVGVDLNSTGHFAVFCVGVKIKKVGRQMSHLRSRHRARIHKLVKARKFKAIKKLSKKFKNRVFDLENKICNYIVTSALNNGMGLKIENLKGIRNRTIYGAEKYNSVLNEWSFYSLSQKIMRKSKILGVKVCQIDPSFSSQNCSRCGLLGTRKKKVFNCDSCGHHDHADSNASFNIAKTCGNA